MAHKKKATKGFTLRCRACNSRLNYIEMSGVLPDGSMDDMCSMCKQATSYSYGIPYKEHEHMDATDGVKAATHNLDYFDNLD